MKKKFSKLIYASMLSICMLASSLNVMAAPAECEVEDYKASEYSGEFESEESYKEYDLSEIPNANEVDEIIDFLQLGNKEFVQQSSVLNIEDIIADADISTFSSDVSGSFTSATFDTGTPGVTWYYDVDYTVSPLSNGIGWYFKSVDVTCQYKKGLSLWTWANTCSITWKKATYTLSPSTKPTSLTVDITLDFSITTNATGTKPVTYSENHSHTTKVENIPL